MDDAAPAPVRTPEPPPEEGRYDYANVQLTGNVGQRYRQIKGVQGSKAATEFALAHIIRFLATGATQQEIAHQFQFSIDYVESYLVPRARAKVKLGVTTDFDPAAVVGEHIQMYRALRENAFLAMNKTQNMTEVDRHRARESLQATLRQEFDFYSKIGGLRGVSINAVADDAHVLAAREMSESLGQLTSQLDDLLRDTDGLDEQLEEPAEAAA